MANLFNLEILTPDRSFFTGEVESVIINTPTGDIEFMAHTFPLVVILNTGIIKIKQSNKWMEAVNGEGFVRVGKDMTTILSSNCIWPYEIDTTKVNEEIDTITSKMKKLESIKEYKMAKAQLAVQIAKLKIKKDKY